MLVLALIVLALSGSRAGTFNITHLSVPELVPDNQNEVEIECGYDANYTILSWFKGPNEFFRYKPGAAPSMRTFPISGVGQIDLLACGPSACRLRLGPLTKEATGFYRCDIERDTPPYKFATRSAYMQVHGYGFQRPLLEGLADEYGEDDEIKVFCKGTPEAQLHWYINGREVEDMKGSAILKVKSSSDFFLGNPPVVTVECAVFRLGKFYRSKEQKARWKDLNHKDERVQEQRNAAKVVEHCFELLCFIIFNQALKMSLFL